MIKTNREIFISIGSLGMLLAVCASAVGFSLQARLSAAHELKLRSELLSRFEASISGRKNSQLESGKVAPAEAFLAATTAGLAAAQLQSYLQQVANNHQATLISSGVEPTRHEDEPDSIRVQITFDAGLQTLQTILYRLESGTPYVFVDSLIVQLSGGGSQGAAEDPLLRITLGLRSLWRRESA
jgi:general secretion pathway protein M